MAAALGVYAYGALNSPLLDGTQAARQAFLRGILADRAPDMEGEEALAEAYWQHYPDVGADPFFGRDGEMGVHGAREHYQMHGRREGRQWPVITKPE